VDSLSDGAQLFFYRLLSVVDDYGRYYASPGTLRGACWPLNPDRVSQEDVLRWLMECSAAELVILYKSGRSRFLQLTDFKQQVRSKSKFPDPDIILLADCAQNDINNTSLVVFRSRISEAEARGAEAEAPRSLPPAEIKSPETPIRKAAPPDTERRIRALAEDQPNPQDFEAGIDRAVQEVLSSANPGKTLATLEENCPLWWRAMRESWPGVKLKPLRYVVQDRDYLRRPREPTPAKSARPPTREERSTEALLND
jgi:hypothetical protein